MINNKRGVIRSIRIPEDLNRLLIDHSKASYKSVNRFIYSILVKYAEWDRISRDFGFVSMPKEIFQSILDITDEEKLIETSKALGAIVFEEMMTFWFKKADINLLLNMLSMYSKYTGAFNFEVSNKNEKEYIIVFHHNMGRKGSILIENLFGEAFKNIMGGPVACEITENQIFMKLSTK